MKSFEIKLYSFAGVFKKQLDPQNISSEISFQEEIDGGQGDMTIDIVDQEANYTLGDIVEIREVGDTDFTVSPAYTGIIEEIGVKEYQYTSLLSIKLLGVFTAMNDLIYKDGASRVFSKSDTAGNLVKLVIASFNIDYGNLSGNTQNLVTTLLREGTILATGPTITISFSDDTCLSAIRKILDGSGLSFFVDSEGKVSVFTNLASVSYTLGAEILSVEKSVNKKEMYNTLFYEVAGGAQATYNSPSAIAIYNKKERKEINTSIGAGTTQNIKGAGLITEFSVPKTEVDIRMRSLQSNLLVPGMLLNIQNTSIPITDQKITKIQKANTQWTVTIGDFSSIGKSLQIN